MMRAPMRPVASFFDAEGATVANSRAVNSSLVHVLTGSPRDQASRSFARGNKFLPASESPSRASPASLAGPYRGSQSCGPVLLV
jgi:hypothetical protein